MKNLLSIILLFTAFNGWGQNAKIDSLQQVLSTENIDSLKVNLLLEIAKTYEPTAPDSNVFYLKKALNISEKTDQADLMIAIADDIGNLFYFTSEHNKRITFCNKYYNKFEEKDLLRGEIYMIYHLAISYQSLSLRDSSYSYFKLGINKADISDNIQKNLKIKMLRSRALDYSAESKYNKSITDLENALLLVDTNNHSIYASIRYVLFNTYFTLGDKEKALAELDFAYKVVQRSSDVVMQANAMYFYSQYYLNNDNKKSLTYALKGYDIFKTNKHEYGVLFMCNILSEIYFQLGYLEKAEEINNYVILNAPKFNLPPNLAAAQTNLGLIELERKNYAKALTYCNESWLFYTEYDDHQLQSKTCECLSLAYEAINESANALYFYKKFKVYEDSISNSDELRNTYKTSYQFELEKKELNFLEKQEKQELMSTQKIKTKNYLIGGVSIFALLIITLGITVVKTRQRKREVEIALQKEGAQAQFSQQLLQSQEDEKVRISRELHDSVGQDLILLKSKAQLNKDVELETAIGNTLDNVRQITQGLHPFVLEQFGLTTALKKLVATTDKSTSIFITEEINNIDGFLTKRQELGVYRIAQEAINNIIKHSESPSAVIATEKDNNSIVLSIKDYGKGFNWNKESDAKDSLGMKTLQERAKILEANLNIDSELKKGTTIYLEIPIKNA